MANNQWHILHPNPENIIYGTDEILNILLKGRGLKNEKKEAEFISPADPKGITSQDVFIDQDAINRAIDRLKKAYKKKESIVIFGDYDCDGVCATAIMWETLNYVGFNVKPYIPNRFKEGYGITPSAIENVIKAYPGVSLIITVDNGIVAHGAVDFARKQKIDTMITDHHQPEENFPKALSIIHTTLVGGSAVAWFFAREILRAFGKEEISDHIALVAMGTISDLIPLIGVNRSLVKYGLNSFMSSRRPGFKSMKLVTGLIDEEIKPYHISYVIAPRINAAGRLDDALEALRLICTKDKLRAQRLALKLNTLNKERQDLVDNTLKSFESNIEVNNNWPIVVSDSNLNEGIIGLIASKLVEKYYRPAIVMSIDKTKVKASARSITGFNIIDAIRSVGAIVLEGGGHPMAAGFSILSEDIDEFKSKFIQNSILSLTPELLEKKLHVDMELNPKSLNEDLVNRLSLFEPFGVDNNKPLFITKKVDLIDKRKVGKSGNHLKFTFSKEGTKLNAIAFNFGNFNALNADIVYEPDINVWNGKKNLDLKIKDMKENEKN